MRAAQANRMKLHQHEIADHSFRKLGVLTHLEGHVVVDRQIGEKRAELKQHAHAAAQIVDRLLVKLVYELPVDSDLSSCRLDYPRDESQQRRLPRSAHPHDGNHLTAWNGHIDPGEHGSTIVGEVDA